MIYNKNFMSVEQCSEVAYIKYYNFQNEKEIL